MPSMEYLLGEIAVDGPAHREEAVRTNKEMGHELAWPEGWWAVSDDQFAYLAFFQFEEDAWAYRLYLINLRMNAKAGRRRYREADKGIEAEERRMLGDQKVRKKRKPGPHRDMLNSTLDLKVGDNFRTDIHHYADFKDEAYIVFVANEGDGTYEGEWEGREQIDLPPGALKAIREEGEAAVQRLGLELPEGTVEALKKL